MVNDLRRKKPIQKKTSRGYRKAEYLSLTPELEGRASLEQACQPLVAGLNAGVHNSPQQLSSQTSFEVVSLAQLCQLHAKTQEQLLGKFRNQTVNNQ
jgi:hypothetical protein